MTTPATTAAPTARLAGASVFYDEVVGLSNVTLDLTSGITGIVGPNGSGKSTLMRVLVGLVSPQEGTVTVLGEPPFTSARVRVRTTFVPATENFFESLTGRQNLEMAFVARGCGRAESRTLATRALELVRLTGDGDRRYGHWSRGMRQRLKLGLSLVSDSDVVLLDEPFLGVDPPNRRQLRDHILELARQERTVIVSSHVLHEIESLTDRVGVLAHGRLLGFGRVQDILTELRDQHPHRVFVRVDDPRRLAAGLVAKPHVRELRVVGEDGLEFVTTQPDHAYRELAGTVVERGVSVTAVETLDNALEAVFEHVTAAGTRRL